MNYKSSLSRFLAHPLGEQWALILVCYVDGHIYKSRSLVSLSFFKLHFYLLQVICLIC